MARAAIERELPLELRDLGPGAQPARAQHGLDRVDVVLLDAGRTEDQKLVFRWHKERGENV